MGSPLLRDLLARIDAASDRGVLPVVVFDLDSTLFSTAPRNLRILKEFVAARRERWPTLEPVVSTLTEADMGWNVHASLAARGFAQPDLLGELKKFWFDRFFSDEYLRTDTETPGAADYVTACHGRGALVYYLTGRHVGGMEVGTVGSLRAAGFPFWRGRCVLHLKPSFEMADRAFKDDAISDVRSYRGEVVGTFENEPGNANLFLAAFPKGLHFLLETICSPEAEKPDPALIRTADFLLPAA